MRKNVYSRTSHRRDACGGESERRMRWQRFLAAHMTDEKYMGPGAEGEKSRDAVRLRGRRGDVLASQHAGFIVRFRKAAKVIIGRA